MGERMFQAKRRVSLLLPGGVANRVVGTTDGVNMTMKQIVDADVAAGAGIAKSKLAALGIVDSDVTGPIGLAKLTHVGAGNVLKSNGTTNAPGQIVNADVAAGAGIVQSKLATLVIGNTEVGVGALHPNRLSSWSGGTFANHVLYDFGAGISVAKVQDSLIADASISQIKLVANAIHVLSGPYSVASNSFAASGGYQAITFNGGTPSITTSPTTYALLFYGWVRWTCTVVNTISSIFMGWNGSAAYEIGTWHEPISGGYQSVSFVVIQGCAPSTTYTMGMWGIWNAGNIAVSSGLVGMMELRR